MRLDEISQIMIGIVVKRESSEQGPHSYELFSLKSYEESLEYERITTTKDLSDKVLREGDLIFRLLYPNKIVYTDKEMAGMLISSQFCIIRAHKEKMDPIILKWYLESKNVETELASMVTGSIIKSMSLSTLKNLEIPDIKKNYQEKMKKLITLWKEEKNITQKILIEKEELYNAYLTEMLEGGNHHARRS